MQDFTGAYPQMRQTPMGGGMSGGMGGGMSGGMGGMGMGGGYGQVGGVHEECGSGTVSKGRICIMKKGYIRI